MKEYFDRELWNEGTIEMLGLNEYSVLTAHNRAIIFLKKQYEKRIEERMKTMRHGADIYEPMYDDLLTALDKYYDAGIPYAGIVGVLDLLKHDILQRFGKSG